MASATPQGAQLLNGVKRLGKFNQGLGSQLPEAYKKFWKEWKNTEPTAVHYIPKEGKWERDEITGKVRAVQNIPIPVIYPPEHNEGLWGGEGVIKGYQKRQPLKKRVPHFWVPVLRRSVVHSTIVNQYLAVTITDRTLELIHASHGFDHYLLKTLACDLRSTLALNLKRRLLQALLNGCPDWKDDPVRQKSVMKEYGQYLEQYTAEEVEWYGLTYMEALVKLKKQLQEQNPIVPEKILFRSKLIEQLKQAGILEAGGTEEITELKQSNIQESTTWLSKMNPFGKKQET